MPKPVKNSGFDQADTSGDGKKQLDFRYILKIWQFFP